LLPVSKSVCSITFWLNMWAQGHCRNMYFRTLQWQENLALQCQMLSFIDCMVVFWPVIWCRVCAVILPCFFAIFTKVCRGVFCHFLLRFSAVSIYMSRYMYDCATFVQCQFDCCISPLLMSALELSWIVAMFAGYLTGTTHSSARQYRLALCFHVVVCIYACLCTLSATLFLQCLLYAICINGSSSNFSLLWTNMWSSVPALLSRLFRDIRLFCKG